MPGQDEVPSVDDEFRALLDTEVDVTADPVDGVPPDQGPKSASGSSLRPIRSEPMRSFRRATRASAVSSPTGTATEIAIQRSPAEPYPAPIRASTA